MPVGKQARSLPGFCIMTPRADFADVLGTGGFYANSCVVLPAYHVFRGMRHGPFATPCTQAFAGLAALWRLRAVNGQGGVELTEE